jgi:hypothetical protein
MLIYFFNNYNNYLIATLLEMYRFVLLYQKILKVCFFWPPHKQLAGGAGNWRIGTGDWKLETGNWRPETRDQRLETGERRTENVERRSEVRGWKSENVERREDLAFLSFSLSRTVINKINENNELRLFNR